ncbi:hypothetical protein Bhyg_04193, partial [Pseudolycoriella hygida]
LEILREGGLEVTAISSTGGLLGQNYFGPQPDPPVVNDEKPTLRPEIVGSIPSVTGEISSNTCTKAPTPMFQSNSMYTNAVDLTVKRRRRTSVEIFRLPGKPISQSANESENKTKSDSSLQITLVPPLTHVQNIHNSQNHNIKRKSSDGSNRNPQPPKNSATESKRSIPSS